MSSFVIIKKAPHMDYHQNLVSLPKNFGTSEYYARKDVQAIIQTVHTNLKELEQKIHFIDELQGKKVIIKPNLVTVFYKLGFKDEAYPETTDPRVLDAIIRFIRPYAKEIVIAESSGRGMPTRASFKMASLHYLSKHYNIPLIPLEEQPVSRYILPNATVMKEILIPQLFTEVVSGESYYISVPKMKTNLYTKVTLGFKNAMGVIPYNLRQRNHNYKINEKLVDMLYLFQPNLTIIDGIIGGEGNTPAPVDPVESHLIISGNNPVETDRITTQIMGVNPESVKLITHASKTGFGDHEVEIIGPTDPIPFRPADPSLMSDRFKTQFPNVKAFVGHELGDAPSFSISSEQKQISSDLIQKMESVCRGGCLASIRTAFDYLRYMGHPTDFKMNVIIGPGVEIDGSFYYFDKEGQAYSRDDIQNLNEKTLAMGTCTNPLKEGVDLYLHGCMPKPVDPVFGLFKLLKYKNYILNPLKNKFFFTFLFATLKTLRVRRKMIKKGVWLDCHLSYTDYNGDIPDLPENQQDQPYIEWLLPPMTKEDKNQFLKLERIEL